MTAPPVDEHNEDFEQLAGLAALGILDGDELARFDQHAAQCERCQLIVRLDRLALAHVSLAAPAMDPSPGFKARLMQRAAAELAASGPATPATPPKPVSVAPRREEPVPIRPRPPNVIPLWRRSRVLSALAAVLVVGLVSLGTYTYENQTVATYELTGSASGRAVVIVRRSGAAELEMDGVADPGPGFLYEAWVIPQAGSPIAAGTTTTGAAKLPLPGNVRGTTVAITRERTRVDAPTSAPVMAAVVQS